MIRPTPRCVAIVAAGVPVALLPSLLGVGAWPAWLLLLVGTVGVAAAELFRLLPARLLGLDVRVPPTIHIGDAEPLAIAIDTGGWPRPVRFALRLEAAETFGGLEATHALVGREPALVELPLRPDRRGRHAVDALWLRWRSPLGLLEHTRRTALDATVQVIPNVRAVRDAALRFFSNREFLSGLKVERYLGDGTEFAALREYQPGLDHRSMDWKASARHRKLLCREHRAERNHQVVLAVDSGYLMREPIDGIPRLDHAINAGLLLSYVCLKSGDRVGFFSFDERVRSYIAPQGGVHAIHALQEHAAALEYTAAETNFTLGLTTLATRLRRRSLVVLLTEFADTVTAELMVGNVQHLAHRHLVMFVTLADPALERLRDARPDSIGAFHRAVIVDGLLRERETVHRRLARSGVQCVDTPPDQVSAALVNRYLDLRRREKV